MCELELGLRGRGVGQNRGGSCCEGFRHKYGLQMHDLQVEWRIVKAGVDSLLLPIHAYIHENVFCPVQVSYLQLPFYKIKTSYHFCHRVFNL
jgi:hypothetical protein